MLHRLFWTHPHQFDGFLAGHVSLLLFVLASFACDDLPLALPVAACHQFWHRRAFLYFRPHHRRDDSLPIFSGPRHRAMSPSRRFVVDILRTGPSRYAPLAAICRISSGLRLRAMPPSRRFESPILLTAPSRNVPFARFVAFPLGRAFALCPPRDDSNHRY